MQGSDLLKKLKVYRVDKRKVSDVALLRCHEMTKNDELGLKSEHHRRRMKFDLLTRIQLKSSDTIVFAFGSIITSRMLMIFKFFEIWSLYH